MSKVDKTLGKAINKPKAKNIPAVDFDTAKYDKNSNKKRTSSIKRFNTCIKNATRLANITKKTKVADYLQTKKDQCKHSISRSEAPSPPLQKKKVPLFLFAHNHLTELST